MSTSRTVCAAVSALVIALAVAACGSSPDSSSATNAGAGAGAGQPGNPRRGFLQDPKVVACLKQQGVTIPDGPRGGNGPSPAGQGRPNRRPDSPQFQKLRAALQKCGVGPREGPPNGQPPQSQGTTGTDAS